jgi:hypothetical protein
MGRDDESEIGPNELIELGKDLGWVENIFNTNYDLNLLKMAVDIFEWYDTETKIVFLEFIRHSLEHRGDSRNTLEFTFGTISQSFIRNICSIKDQLVQFLNISVKSQDSNVIAITERIIFILVSHFFDSSLHHSTDEFLSDVDK